MIKGERIPRNIVADTLIKADTDAVMEALDKMSGAEDISNKRAYFIATLYNTIIDSVFE